MTGCSKVTVRPRDWILSLECHIWPFAIFVPGKPGQKPPKVLYWAGEVWAAVQVSFVESGHFGLHSEENIVSSTLVCFIKKFAWFILKL